MPQSDRCRVVTAGGFPLAAQVRATPCPARRGRRPSQSRAHERAKRSRAGRNGGIQIGAFWVLRLPGPRSPAPSDSSTAKHPYRKPRARSSPLPSTRSEPVHAPADAGCCRRCCRRLRPGSPAPRRMGRSSVRASSEGASLRDAPQLRGEPAARVLGPIAARPCPAVFAHPVTRLGAGADRPRYCADAGCGLRQLWGRVSGGFCQTCASSAFCPLLRAVDAA